MPRFTDSWDPTGGRLGLGLTCLMISTMAWSPIAWWVFLPWVDDLLEIFGLGSNYLTGNYLSGNTLAAVIAALVYFAACLLASKLLRNRGYGDFAITIAIGGIFASIFVFTVVWMPWAAGI